MHQINFIFTNTIFWFRDLVYFPCVYQRYVCICACALITEARRRNRILWDRSYRCLWIRWVLGTNPGPLQEQKVPFTPEPAPQPQRLACFKINIKGKILHQLYLGNKLFKLFEFFVLDIKEILVSWPQIQSKQLRAVYVPLVLRSFICWPCVMFRWTYLRTSKSLSIIHINTQFRSIRIKYSD